jgi:hypothetical protein
MGYIKASLADINVEYVGTWVRGYVGPVQLPVPAQYDHIGKPQLLSTEFVSE